jgi:trans-L-3-hydroxyproline dehydratase
MVARDLVVDTPTFGRVTGDIAFGGAFYFYTDAAPHGLDVRESDIERLIRFGAEVKIAANAKYPVVHPHIPELNHIYGTIVNGAPRHPGSTQANCCVFADRQVDRSPTGSGTAGRIAQLVARGELDMDTPIQNESVIGSIMRGRAVRRTTVGQYDAVVPEISGSASIYGFANWVLDDREPLDKGFLVR